MIRSSLTFIPEPGVYMFHFNAPGDPDDEHRRRRSMHFGEVVVWRKNGDENFNPGVYRVEVFWPCLNDPRGTEEWLNYLTS
jgi:hypothetical protein